MDHIAACKRALMFFDAGLQTALVDVYWRRKMTEINLDKNHSLMALIQSALWGSLPPKVEQSVYDEMKKHALSALPACILSSLSMPDELRQVWRMNIYQHIAYNTNYMHEQEALPISVPYVILKGSSAAKYYPRPELRAMGDIDIMPQRKDYQTACDMLLAAGYVEIVRDNHSNIERHREFEKERVIIEVHAYFAALNDPAQAEYLDNLIIQNINPSHMLPDLINGLVLLEHISHHLELGLGLRQIIDWMMFVNQCLPDEKWPEFHELVKKIGLEKLAAVCTRMCEIYLGLPHRQWCADADIALCEQLMDYVLACGNFGNKKEYEADVSERAFSNARTLKTAFRFLQKRGLGNWKVAEEHKLLRPFAWIYQVFHYASQGLKRDHAISKMLGEYASSKEKMAFLDALGVRTEVKGRVKYKDGKYVKV